MGGEEGKKAFQWRDARAAQNLSWAGGANQFSRAGGCIRKRGGQTSTSQMTELAGQVVLLTFFAY